MSSRIGPYKTQANVSRFAQPTPLLSTVPEGIAQYQPSSLVRCGGQGSSERGIINAYLVRTTINLTDMVRQGTLSRYAT